MLKTLLSHFQIKNFPYWLDYDFNVDYKSSLYLTLRLRLYQSSSICIVKYTFCQIYKIWFLMYLWKSSLSALLCSCSLHKFGSFKPHILTKWYLKVGVLGFGFVFVFCFSVRGSSHRSLSVLLIFCSLQQYIGMIAHTSIYTPALVITSFQELHI